MPLWFLIAMGLTGVVVVTRKGAKGAPVRRGSARAPAGGFAFPSGASGVSDGFPVYGSATGDNASNAASLGLTPDEFSHMAIPAAPGGAPDSSGASSEAASLGLSDDEYAHMTDTSGNASAPSPQPSASQDSGDASAPSPQPSASQDSGDAGDASDQSVDMGSNVGTDMDPSAASFPGAEGTSVNGFTSYGEIHPTVGAPIVYDQDSNPYVVSPEGHLYPC